MTNRERAADDFIDNEGDAAHVAIEAARQLSETMLDAAAATPWGEAFTRWRAQQMLAQKLCTETNVALGSLGRQARYVPGLHDADLWRRIEERLNRAAADLATDTVDQWRAEQDRYLAGERDTPPPWPTIEEDNQ